MYCVIYCDTGECLHEKVKPLLKGCKTLYISTKHMIRIRSEAWVDYQVEYVNIYKGFQGVKLSEYDSVLIEGIRVVPKSKRTIELTKFLSTSVNTPVFIQEVKWLDGIALKQMVDRSYV